MGDTPLVSFNVIFIYFSKKKNCMVSYAIVYSVSDLLDNIALIFFAL